MLNDTLYLQPNHYLTLSEELCFFMGGRVFANRPETREGLINELIDSDHLTVCNHVIREESDYYEMMTSNYIFRVRRSEFSNFYITGISSGKEFLSQKKYYYNRGVFQIFADEGIAVVADGVKYGYGNVRDWGMDPEAFKLVCDRVDEYFGGTDRFNVVDSKFNREIIQPVKIFTRYEHRAEQIEANKENYVNYDSCEFVRGKSKEKVYSFFSSSFDPNNEHYQPKDWVEIETNEEINSNCNRKLRGVVLNRTDDEIGTTFIISFIDQFDDEILIKYNGHIFLVVNDTQKRVRTGVIQSIEDGSVTSDYMYRLFGINGHPSNEEEEAPGWEAFKRELLSKPVKPNDSQMEAIERGIKTKDIQLVLGPPGTGKTTVIVNWVKYFIKNGKRVLISSQNNSAVDNVLERVGKDDNARIIRIGNIEKIQDNCKQFAPESQVESVAKAYIDSLNSSLSQVENDIISIQKKLVYINSVYDDFVLFSECRKTLTINASLLKGKVENIKNLRKEMLNDYERCNDLYTQRTHKDIALFSLMNTSAISRLINKPVIKRIENEANLINSEIAGIIDQITVLSHQYNDNVKELESLLDDAKYIAAKKEYYSITDKCRNHTIHIELSGPFSVDIIDSDYLLSDGVDTVEKLKKYKDKLADILGRLQEVKKAMSDWGRSIESNRTEIITNLLIENSNIVGATCIGINSHYKFKSLKFDVSIIDESGQIQIHNAIVPMTRAPKTLMLGDHLQIPPNADETVVKLCRENAVPEKQIELLGKSFFEFLFTRFERINPSMPNITRLNEQFRMPGVISDVISEWFYEGNYHARYDMSKWHPLIGGTSSPLVMISTSNDNHRFETAEVGGGYSNELEAKTIAKIIASFAKRNSIMDASEASSPKIGIISAYGKQVGLIRKRISEEKLGLNPNQIYSIASSLDSFQGQERPLIIYSCTRSADPKAVPPYRARVGFLKELRRLNVAFTRCQIQLVIIGDFDYLTTCEYEKKDEDTGEVVPNQSEKRFSEFMLKMISQAKSPIGNYYYLDDFMRGQE